ncbi:MAG: BON domain-containing protein [Acidobacteria bacterium]|nr:BON domain-containing protein [Acidobacteriota bacterium]
MTSRKTYLGLVAALVAVAAFAGCATTQSPGEQMDDAGIHAKVKAKLTAERFSNITNVDVNVTNGVVTLAGEVPSAEVKAEAEREVWTVSGVKQVINNLQVSGEGSQTGSPGSSSNGG